MLVRFYKSASGRASFVTDALPQVAFVGRSNAGKSSALNAICGAKAIARVSKTPGRTQLVNYFQLGKEDAPTGYLVDLPGYGYAKASKSAQATWQKTVNDYFDPNPQLKAVVMIMDIRHPLTPFDETMLEWAGDNGWRVHILLTKADKMSRGAANNVLFAVQKQLPAFATAQVFSSPEKRGVDEAWKILNNELGITNDKIAPLTAPQL